MSLDFSVSGNLLERGNEIPADIGAYSPPPPSHIRKKWWKGQRDFNGRSTCGKKENDNGGSIREKAEKNRVKDDSIFLSEPLINLP